MWEHKKCALAGSWPGSVPVIGIASANIRDITMKMDMGRFMTRIPTGNSWYVLALSIFLELVLFIVFTSQSGCG